MTTDESKLKLALAKMLPSVIEIETPSYMTLEGWHEGEPYVSWQNSHKGIKDSELLHICSLIESTLTEQERDDYYYSGLHQKDEDHSWTVSAPWQLRAEKLAKVKGVEL